MKTDTCVRCQKEKPIVTHLNHDKSQPLCAACNMAVRRSNPSLVKTKMIGVIAKMIAPADTALCLSEQDFETFEGIKEQLNALGKKWFDFKPEPVTLEDQKMKPVSGPGQVHLDELVSHPEAKARVEARLAEEERAKRAKSVTHITPPPKGPANDVAERIKASAAAKRKICPADPQPESADFKLPTLTQSLPTTPPACNSGSTDNEFVKTCVPLVESTLEPLEADPQRFRSVATAIAEEILGHVGKRPRHVESETELETVNR